VLPGIIEIFDNVLLQVRVGSRVVAPKKVLLLVQYGESGSSYILVDSVGELV